MSGNIKRAPFMGRNVVLALVWTVFSRGFKASGVSEPLSSLSFLKSLHTSPLYRHTSGAPPYHYVVCPVLHHLCVRTCLVCCMRERHSDFNIFSHVCRGTVLKWASRLLDSRAVLHSYWTSLSWKNTLCVWAWQRKHRLKDSLLSSQQLVCIRQRHVSLLEQGWQITELCWGQHTFIMRLWPSAIPGDDLSSATYLGMSNPGSSAQHYWCSIACKRHNSLIQEVVFEAIFMKTRQQFLCHLLWPHPTQSSQKILCRAQRWISLTANAVKWFVFD